MPEFKIVINDIKSGESYQKVVDINELIGMKIGDKVNGDMIGLKGYELEIRGGSDKTGFPMRAELHGSGVKKLLLKGGSGVKIKRKGMKKRKSVTGNTVGVSISQINLKIIKYGAKSLEEIFGKKEKKVEEKSKKEIKESVKKEEKKEAKEEKK